MVAGLRNGDGCERGEQGKQGKQEEILWPDIVKQYAVYVGAKGWSCT